MATTTWKGHLTFGLISVPVRLSAAARTKSAEFHMVNPETMGRVQQKLWDPIAETFIARNDLGRAATLPDGTKILVTEDERKAVEPPSSKQMEVVQFVPVEQVNPLLFDASYYIAPDDNGKRAFALLLTALHQMARAAVAKLARGNREHLVVIRPDFDRGGLVLHTLYYEDEVREAPAITEVEIGAQELDMARMFVDRMTTNFDHGEFRDEYRHAIAELVQSKATGIEMNSAQPAAIPPPVIDLMAALKASLDKLEAAA